MKLLTDKTAFLEPLMIELTPAASMSPPRTVLFVAGAAFFSGAERALLMTIRSLDPERYRAVVAVGADGEMLTQLRNAGITVEHVPLCRTDWGKPLPWVSSVWSLARAARRLNARVIHANEVPSFQPAGQAARLIGIPAVTHARFPDELGAAAWFLKPGFARALFVSKYLQQDGMAKAPAVFRARSEVLYDGVEMPELPDSEAWRARREELDLPPGIPVVAITGQIAEVKGIWEFIEAARLLCARGVPGIFAVLGDDLKGQGLLRRDALERVRTLGLEDRFRFLGFRRDAPRVIPLFDIVAVPSHVEPLGNATLEAMAAARPVVGSRVGGIPEMIVDGVTGSLVPSKSPFELAHALERLLGDGERRRAFGAAGRRRVEEAFSLRAHAEQLQATYDDILSRRALGRTA